MLVRYREVSFRSWCYVQRYILIAQEGNKCQRAWKKVEMQSEQDGNYMRPAIRKRCWGWGLIYQPQYSLFASESCIHQPDPILQLRTSQQGGDQEFPNVISCSFSLISIRTLSIQRLQKLCIIINKSFLTERTLRKCYSKNLS